jgi:uncharacterized membrane protein (UPF0127 family)|tara:strand:- start:283 stop:636 length:354 start_codon:yes stop_codon:yes gene_type:complete
MDKIIINNLEYTTQIQQTNTEIAQGMQGRMWNNIQSMYFVLAPRMQSFHTQNCLVPMDIVFCLRGKVFKIFPNCQPNANQTYKSFADAVVELPANTVFKHKIILGQTVTLWQENQHH